MQMMDENVMNQVKFHYKIATKMCTPSVQRMRVSPHRAEISNPDALHYTLLLTHN